MLDVTCVISCFYLITMKVCCAPHEAIKILRDCAHTWVKVQLPNNVPSCVGGLPNDIWIKGYFEEAYSARIDPARQSSNQQRFVVICQRQGRVCGVEVKTSLAPKFAGGDVQRRGKGLQERDKEGNVQRSGFVWGEMLF